MKERDYKVFNCHMKDTLYDQSYGCYDNLKNSLIFKCKFDINKTTDEGGRVIYKPMHPDQIPATELINSKVLKAKDQFSNFKKNAIVEVEKLTGRDRPCSSHHRLLKNNENYY